MRNNERANTFGVRRYSLRRSCRHYPSHNFVGSLHKLNSPPISPLSTHHGFSSISEFVSSHQDAPHKLNIRVKSYSALSFAPFFPFIAIHPLLPHLHQRLNFLLVICSENPMCNYLFEYFLFKVWLRCPASFAWLAMRNYLFGKTTN